MSESPKEKLTMDIFRAALRKSPSVTEILEHLNTGCMLIGYTENNDDPEDVIKYILRRKVSKLNKSQLVL